MHYRKQEMLKLPAKAGGFNPPKVGAIKDLQRWLEVFFLFWAFYPARIPRVLIFALVLAKSDSNLLILLR
jgi:hypothetical protein